MRKCPKCGKTINLLKCYISSLAKEFNFSVNPKGEIKYEYVGVVEAGGPIYCCPKCGDVLFRGEDKAKKFLSTASRVKP